MFGEVAVHPRQTFICVPLKHISMSHKYKVVQLWWGQDNYSLKTHCFIGIGIRILNLRQSSDRLRFIMGIPIPAKQCLFLGIEAQEYSKSKYIQPGCGLPVATCVFYAKVYEWFKHALVCNAIWQCVKYMMITALWSLWFYENPWWILELTYKLVFCDLFFET